MSQPIKKEPQSETIKQEWQEIPLKACTSEELNDTRYHIMKFISKQDVNIIDNFVKPVRLHRKDPRNIQFHLTRHELDIRKRENEQLKREKQEADEIKTEENGDVSTNVAPALSQVAPDGGARKQKKNLFKRKTRQINLMDDAKRKLRYEEHYPWVIEDYDGQNVFVGNYEAGSSESQHVLFVFDKDGFKMIPAEKVYRFTPRNKYATLTLEEAEAKMERNASVPRWLMKHMEDRMTLDNTPDQRFRNSPSNGTFNRSVASTTTTAAGNTTRRLRTVIGGSNERGTNNDRDSDHDDLDYDEEFADDEEAPIMDGDEEENKLSERKIKKEMLKAAHFDGKSDVEGDLDDLDDLFETEKTRKVDKEGKKLRKVLNKREGGVYDDDDDEEEGLLPYLSKSDLESNEESDEEEETIVKQEEDVKIENAIPQQYQRTIYVHNIDSGYVTIKAPASFLSTLPKGEWNPQIRKRQTPELITSPKKKIKLEESVSPIPIVSSPTKSPSPISSTVDLNSSGPDNVLVTVKDVLDIVRNNPLTTKELLVGLKSRVSAHKDNKQRIISIVKQNLKLVDGKLVLKE